MFQRAIFRASGAPSGGGVSPCPLRGGLGAPHTCSCRLLGLEAAYIFVEISDEVTWKCTRLKLSASLEQVVVKEHTQAPQ